MPEVRLIDANALIKNIAESIRLADEWEKESHEKKDKHGIKCAIDTRRSLLSMISRVKDAPTIEPEVRHVRWIPHKITASSICSECRRVFADETLFCPNCGARMDGGADNGSR